MPDLDWTLPEGQAYEWFVATPGAILLIVVVGLLIRWFVYRAIDRFVARTVAASEKRTTSASRAINVLEHPRPGARERRRQRVETMGSMLKSIATFVILAVVAVMALAELGVNIAPIIASAGIVGVAVGFGAQNLVRDFLSGIFMILEDQYGVGDVIDAGEAVGTVEAVSLRVTRLRDVSGTVWYVRNGEIIRIGNQSQNWARSVLDITVAYDSDLDLVRDILTDESARLHEDETFRSLILEPPEVWGVERFDKDGVVIRLVLKTAPLEQWRVAREMRRRVKERFDSAGVVIPVSWAVGPVSGDSR